MQELHRVLNMPQYGLICLKRMRVCVDMSGYITCNNRQGSEYVSYSARSSYKLMNTY